MRIKATRPHLGHFRLSTGRVYVAASLALHLSMCFRPQSFKMTRECLTGLRVLTVALSAMFGAST